MQTVKTIPGKTYAVESAGEVTITNTETGAIAAQGYGSGQVLFTACANSYEVSDDTAKVVALFKLAPRLKLALLQGGAGGWLPKGFTELEYLESSGTQHIDTGIVPQTDTRMFIDCERLKTMTGNNSIFGCRNTVNGNVREYDALFQQTSPERLYIRPYIYPSNPSYFEFPSGRFTAELTGRDIVVNGASVKAYTPGGTLETERTLWLLAMNYGTGAINQWSILRIYRFRLSSPKAPLIDLIPALRKSDRTAGFYDKVSKQFLENVGTGTFGYRIKGTDVVVKPNATTYALRAPRDPYYVAPSGVYARKAGENEPEVLADTEETTGEGWEWFANTAEAYEYLGIVQDNEELLTE